MSLAAPPTSPPSAEAPRPLVGLAFALEAIRIRDEALAREQVQSSNGPDEEEQGEVAAASSAAALLTGLDEDSGVAGGHPAVPLHHIVRSDSPDVLTVSRNSDWLVGVGLIGGGGGGQPVGLVEKSGAAGNNGGGNGAAAAGTDDTERQMCACCPRGATVSSPALASTKNEPEEEENNNDDDHDGDAAADDNRARNDRESGVIQAEKRLSSNDSLIGAFTPVARHQQQHQQHHSLLSPSPAVGGDGGVTPLLLLPSLSPASSSSALSSRYLPSPAHILAFPPLSPRSFRKRLKNAGGGREGGAATALPEGEEEDEGEDEKEEGEDGRKDEGLGERLGLYPDFSSVSAPSSSSAAAGPATAASPAAASPAAAAPAAAPCAATDANADAVGVVSVAALSEGAEAEGPFVAGITNTAKLTSAPHYALGRVEVAVGGEPFTMPAHFGLVEEGVYRCAFPAPDSYPFLERLGLKTIINLLDRLPREYEVWLRRKRIAYYHLAVKGNKTSCDEMDRRRVNLALALMMDRRRHPVLLHCRSGKHRTGAVVGCIRMLQGSSMDHALGEYCLYCQHKQRAVDKLFIERFDPRRLKPLAPPAEFLASWLKEDCLERTSRLEAMGGDSVVVVAAEPQLQPSSSISCTCSCHSRAAASTAATAATAAIGVSIGGLQANQRPTILGGGVFFQQQQSPPTPAERA